MKSQFERLTTAFKSIWTNTRLLVDRLFKRATKTTSTTINIVNKVISIVVAVIFLVISGLTIGVVALGELLFAGPEPNNKDAPLFTESRIGVKRC